MEKKAEVTEVLQEMLKQELEKKTRDRLMDLGKKGESYDQIINRLIDFWLKRKR